MQQFECVLCGGTDIEKRDSIYYCNTCGCRYSEKEAKKLMDESTSNNSGAKKIPSSFSAGTISSNNSAVIDNNLLMARNALQAENYKEAEAYSTRVIESDGKNWEAWFIKGKSAGLQSTFYNMRIKEAANSFIKALDCCPKDKQLSLAEDCATQMIRMISGLLRFRLKDYCEFYRDRDDEDIKKMANVIDEINAISTTVVLSLMNTPQISIDTTKKFSTFMIPDDGSMIYAIVVKEIMKEAWDRVERRHRKIEHPDTDDIKRYAGDIISISGGIATFATAMGDNFSNGIRNKLIIDLYEQAIEISKKLIGLRAYSPTFAFGDIHYVSAEIGDTFSAQRNDYQRRISEIKRVAPAQIEAAAKKSTEDYWKAHSKEKEKLISEKEKLTAEKNSLEKTISELEKTKNDVPAKPYLNDISNRITAWMNQKNTVPGLSEKANIETHISDLQSKHSKLGIFKGKEKKEIEAQIEEARRRLPEVQRIIDYHIAAIDSQIAPLSVEKDRLQSIVSQQQAQIETGISPYREKLNKINARITEINEELTKPR